MRVLFYGGCHATVLNSLFSRFCTAPGFQSRSILNYELIAALPEFPLDTLEGFDAVVYNPIFHQEGHKTDRMEAEARRRGLKLICYPWLQWNGYFPQAVKIDLYQHDFFYPALFAGARDNPDFESFRLWATEGYLLPEWITDLEGTTARLREYETGADVTISDFVLANYRRLRLFNTPSHPTTVLYRHVAKKIAEALGVELDPSLDGLSSEIQGEFIMPILPKVAHHLQLDFNSTEMRNSGMGDRLYGLTEWLRVYWHSAKSSGRAMWPAYESSLVDAEGRVHQVAQFELVFARKLEDGDTYRVLGGGRVPAGDYKLGTPFWHSFDLKDPPRAW